MTRFINKPMRKFLRDENGAANTIEFVLWVPLFLILIIATIELGAMTLRHTQLERALDYTVRTVRLGTGEEMTHAALKTQICENTTLLKHCEDTLQLEMIPLDLRNWSEPPVSVDCVDTAKEVNPLRQFDAGTDNELMYLRACYKYEPIAPTGLLAKTVFADEDGYTKLVSFSAFVQEPSS
ncbi:TadE family protein [Marivita sp. GX14005]|uniref:TadE/TadG family type IV pilus assembly protein n=1 Tax=Marivita sp. GX14005 TaxID=2942276 RepID=UPI0020197C7F|nr:TadE family protein [Marivita sp. GX14005]MCL3881174.1 pilus assembly protein [Marivita sp. GX14005]